METDARYQLTDHDQIAEVLGTPPDFVVAKLGDRLDDPAGQFIALAPLVFLATLLHSRDPATSLRRRGRAQKSSGAVTVGGMGRSSVGSGLLVLGLTLGACGSTTTDPISSRDPTSSLDAPDASVPTSQQGAEVDTNESTYVGPLTFAWPTSACEVPVTEVVLKDGSQATLEYRIGITSIPDGIQVSYVDMVVADVNGEPVPPEAADELNAAVAVLPSFVVGSDGLAVGLTGTEEINELLDEISPGSGTGLSPEALAALEEQVITKYWDTWVGFWAGLGEVAEGSTDRTVPLPFGDTIVDVAFVVENLGLTSGGDVTLRSTQTIEGPDAARAMGVSMELFGGDATEFEAQTTDARRVTVTEVVSDPSTLRPVTASFDTATDLTINSENFSDQETRNWTFNWESSSCATT